MREVKISNLMHPDDGKGNALLVRLHGPSKATFMSGRQAGEKVAGDEVVMVAPNATVELEITNEATLEIGAYEPASRAQEAELAAAEGPAVMPAITDTMLEAGERMLLIARRSDQRDDRADAAAVFEQMWAAQFDDYVLPPAPPEPENDPEPTGETKPS